MARPGCAAALALLALAAGCAAHRADPGSGDSSGDVVRFGPNDEMQIRVPRGWIGAPCCPESSPPRSALLLHSKPGPPTLRSGSEKDLDATVVGAVEYPTPNTAAFGPFDELPDSMGVGQIVWKRIEHSTVHGLPAMLFEEGTPENGRKEVLDIVVVRYGTPEHRAYFAGTLPEGSSVGYAELHKILLSGTRSKP